jgi:hypothetical protein
VKPSDSVIASAVIAERSGPNKPRIDSEEARLLMEINESS